MATFFILTSLNHSLGTFMRANSLLLTTTQELFALFVACSYNIDGLATYRYCSFGFKKDYLLSNSKPPLPFFFGQRGR